MRKKIEKKKRGRPKKYANNWPKKAFEFAAKGLTERQISLRLGISQETLINYKSEYSEFSEAIKRGQQESIDKVENSLFKRAVGYEYTETKIEKSGDYEKTIKTKKKVIPDTTAQIFFLKNRRAEIWREKQDIAHSGKIDTGIDLSKYTKEELLKLAGEEDG